MKEKEKLFSEPKIWNWCFEMLQVLAYMQRHGYFHQNLKTGRAKTSGFNLAYLFLSSIFDVNSYQPSLASLW
jgi:hypothetical protein